MKRLGKTDPQYKGTNAPVSRILVDLLNESLLRREAAEGGKE